MADQLHVRSAEHLHSVWGRNDGKLKKSQSLLAYSGMPSPMLKEGGKTAGGDVTVVEEADDDDEEEETATPVGSAVGTGVAKLPPLGVSGSSGGDWGGSGGGGGGGARAALGRPVGGLRSTASAASLTSVSSSGGGGSGVGVGSAWDVTWASVAVGRACRDLDAMVGSALDRAAHAMTRAHALTLLPSWCTKV